MVSAMKNFTARRDESLLHRLEELSGICLDRFVQISTSPLTKGARCKAIPGNLRSGFPSEIA